MISICQKVNEGLVLTDSLGVAKAGRLVSEGRAALGAEYSGDY